MHSARRKTPISPAGPACIVRQAHTAPAAVGRQAPRACPCSFLGKATHCEGLGATQPTNCARSFAARENPIAILQENKPLWGHFFVNSATALSRASKRHVRPVAFPRQRRARQAFCAASLYACRPPQAQPTGGQLYVRCDSNI